MSFSPDAAWVERMTEPEPNSGCWLWLGARNPKGYGSVDHVNPVTGRCTYRAHRAVYEIFRGHISPGLEIDHRCRNKTCVNPAHLDVVTGVENQRRRRHGTCKYGHEMVSTTYGTVCPTCRVTRCRAWHAARTRSNA